MGIYVEPMYILFDTEFSTTYILVFLYLFITYSTVHNSYNFKSLNSILKFTPSVSLFHLPEITHAHTRSRTQFVAAVNGLQENLAGPAEGLEGYEVDSIIECRYWPAPELRNDLVRELQFKVRWKRYTEVQDTWLPEKALSSAMKALNKFKMDNFSDIYSQMMYKQKQCTSMNAQHLDLHEKHKGRNSARPFVSEFVGVDLQRKCLVTRTDLVLQTPNVLIVCLSIQYCSRHFISKSVSQEYSSSNFI